MPVQIPQLRRNPVPGDASVGRIEVQQPDLVKPMAQQQAGLEKVGSDIENYMRKEEDYAINTDALARAQSFEVKYKSRLKELDGLKGDPTEAYHKLSQDVASWQSEELAGPTADASAINPATGRRVDAIRDAVTRVRSRLDDQASVRQAAQTEAYRSNTEDASVINGQNAMAVSAETLNAKDPASLGRIRQNIEEITLIRRQAGERKGLSPDDPIVRGQIAKDVSKGLINSIEILNAAGKTDEAKMIMDQYGDELIAKDRLKSLKEEHSQAVIDKTAYTESDKYSMMPVDKAYAEIDKRKDLAPDVRNKIRQILDGRDRQMKHAVASREKESFDMVSKKIFDESMGANPIQSMVQLEASPSMKNALRNMSDSQRKAIARTFKQGVTETDPEVQTKFLDAVKDGSLRGMSTGDFMEMYGKASKNDKPRMMSQYVSSNTDNMSEVNHRDRAVVAATDKALIDFKAVKSVGQKATAKDKRRRSEAVDAVRAELASLPPNTPQAEFDKRAKDLIAKKMTGDGLDGSVQDPSEYLKTRPTPAPTPTATSVVPPATVSKPVSYSKLNTQQKQAAQSAWQRKFGRPWDVNKDGMTQMNAFVSKGIQ